MMAARPRSLWTQWLVRQLPVLALLAIGACTVQVTQQSGFNPCDPNPCTAKGVCGGWTGVCTVKNNAPSCGTWAWTDKKNAKPTGADGKALTKPAGYEVSELTCDGKDNDCDGQTDEGTVGDPAKSCPAVGVCAGTKPAMLCLGGQWLCGFGATLGYEASETTWDGKDNDCDGQTDEGVQPKATDCKRNGVCSGLDAPVCGGETGWNCGYDKAIGYEAAETLCDGKDNDCDGAADANLTAAALAGKATCSSVGVCNGSSAIVCKGGDPVCTYTAANYQALETLCDGADNDCDGQTDTYPGSDLPLQATDTAGCSTKGVCAAKGAVARVCTAGQFACSYAKAASYEASESLCDGKDNDCDGSVDNIATKPSPSPCGSKGVCAAGVTTCASNLWQCDWSTIKDYEAFEMTCDGKDNDCDGTTDETPDTAKSGCTAVGVCQWGVAVTCTAAKPTCDYTHVLAYQDVTETLCDGLDNNCNGKTDEPETLDGSKSGCTQGVCAGKATATCSAGKWACDTLAAVGFEATEKTCDGKDNDCDGLTDEGLSDATSCPALGVCSAGVTAACLGGKYACNFSAATGYEASEATCDGKDNDCDGKTDTGLCAPAAACASNDQCATGVCVAISGGTSKVCALDSKQCASADAAGKVTLIDNGAAVCASSDTQQTCTAGTLSAAKACASDKPACVAGQCVVCAPNAKTCDPADKTKVVQCAADGLSSSPVTTCGSGEKCAGGGDCVADGPFALGDTAEAVVWHDAAVLSSGDVAAVWTVDKGNAGELRIRLFSATGAAKGPSTIGHGIRKPIKGSRLAATAIGTGFAVAWVTTGDDDDIALGLFDKDGKPVGSPTIANDPDTTSAQNQPAITSYGTTLVLAWAAEDLDFNGYAIGARTFDATGKPVSKTLTVNDTAAVSDALDGDQDSPAVACKASGDCAVVFTHKQASGKGKIRGRALSSAGTLGNALVTISTAANSANQTQPTIAWTGTSFLVAWSAEGVESGSGTGIAIRPYDVNLSVLGGAVVTQANEQTAGNQAQPWLRARNGGAALVWNVAGLGSVRDFSATAAPLAAEANFGSGATATLAMLTRLVVLADGKQLLQFFNDKGGTSPAVSTGQFR